jgi:hypothetical protein
MTYEKAEKLFASAKDKNAGKPIDNNTRIVKREDKYAIRLHNTDIVIFYPDGRIKLNSGGWKTRTTKDRINNALGEYPHSVACDYCIHSDRGIWYIWKAGTQVCIFNDGMVINPDGSLSGGLPIEDAKKSNKIRTQCRKYAKAYIEALFEGEVSKPGNRDCWYCLMVDTITGKPMGEGQSDHIQSHIDEKYYGPSLLVNAIRRYPVSACANSVLAELWQGETQQNLELLKKIDRGGGWYGIAKEQLQKSLYRYCLTQFGLQA